MQRSIELTFVQLHVGTAAVYAFGYGAEGFTKADVTARNAVRAALTTAGRDRVSNRLTLADPSTVKLTYRELELFRRAVAAHRPARVSKRAIEPLRDILAESWREWNRDIDTLIQHAESARDAYLKVAAR